MEKGKEPGSPVKAKPAREGQGPGPEALISSPGFFVKGFKLSYHFLGTYSKSYGFLCTLTRINPLSKNPVSVPARATGVWTGSSEAVML